MDKTKILTKSTVVVCVTAFVLVGCDQLSSLKEYFVPKSKQTKQTPSVPIPPPQQAPQTQTIVQSSAPAQEAPLGENELARVGKWSITIQEFNERLNRLKEVVPDFNINDLESKKLVLDELIRQQLLVIDAEARGVDKGKDIQDAVEEFRRTLLVREVATNLTKDTVATEQEAQDYYDKNKEAMVEPTEWHVREIVTNTEDGAKEILVALYGGADFAQIAKERSVSKSAANGGDLGFITEAPFSQMKSALMSLEVGNISSVLKGPDDKFYIIKLEEKKGGKTKEFTELKDEIVKGLTLLKQQQAIVDYLNKLAEKIPAKVNEKLLEK